MNIIFIIPAAILVFMYYFAIKEDKKIYRILYEKARKMDKQEPEIVANIIRGNYKQIPEAEQVMYTEAYKKWKEKYEKMFDQASRCQKYTIYRNLKNWKHNEYNGEFSNDIPGKEYSLVLENCFTERFPSTHDMAEFFLLRLASELTVLKVIEAKKIEKYLIHIKKHFTNHKMVQGITVVDVYCKI